MTRKTREKWRRNEIMVEMRDKDGLTFEEIGRYFEVSRQRVHQVWKVVHPNGRVRPVIPMDMDDEDE